ncbi:hypothetical protein GGS23DRAFT_607726 [Durotheca rogersii]|uniref:uncharacterized protein n=1 Tax=Durotheca rogersii TaxID=419775 RepID=UPI00221E5BC9|nr:uncharacterized protein GGS23DRAFT_607726 [Durotheca rogersii]KAI5858199.1 hypothetical protein GGS23DRAFT_607726 [Durotheca rogersii]
MLSKQLFSAVAALGMASGVMGISCDDTTATIRSQADATQLANCETVDGNVVIDRSVVGLVDLGGSLREIGGDLRAENNGLLETLQSSSLRTIGGVFALRNVTRLNSLSFQRLSSVGSIDWVTLSALNSINFGTPGITRAQSVVIADTFLQTIEGINVETVTDININNNRRLARFSSSIKSLSNTLQVQANAANLTFELPNLTWIANMTIANVTSFSAPSLRTVNGSMRFDSNGFSTFIAPNLTEIQDGDLSFVSNAQLTNVSLPNLRRVGGGFTIANNTALERLDGFSGLQEIGGAVKVRGSFTNVQFPVLEDVKGAFEVTSTEDIENACSNLSGLRGGVVQGSFSCTGNNANANNDTSDADSSGSGSSNNPDSAASPISASTPTLFALTALGAFFTVFL